MNVVGIGTSAAVEITLFPGNNSASVTVLPNFNMNRVTLEGKLIPYDGSGRHRGGALLIARIVVFWFCPCFDMLSKYRAMTDSPARFKFR